MLKKVLLGLAVLIVALVIVVMLQPSTYRVERSTQIQAPAAVVFATLQDFQAWKGWQPWWKASDKVDVDGQPGTVGHSSTFSGPEMGSGTMTITAADAPRHLGLQLVVKEPMAGEADQAFDLADAEGGTKVTWSQDGKNGFVYKFFSLFMDVPAMIGEKFDEGLADLKTAVEQEATKTAPPAAEDATPPAEQKAPPTP